MSKRNKKTYPWRTQREFTTFFVNDVHQIIESLWEILNFFSTRVVQSIDEKFLASMITVIRPIPEDVHRVISDLKRLIEKSREIERVCDRCGDPSNPDSCVVHTSRLVHIEVIKDTLKDSCRRVRRNCELLHENCLLKEKLYNSSSCSSSKSNAFRL